ncbi:hypothetical protein JCM9492_10100 [Aquifex pyrophilus]
MKLNVLFVKNQKQKERALRKLLRRKKVVAVVNRPEDLKRDLIKKADVVILEENEENSLN